MVGALHSLTQLRRLLAGQVFCFTFVVENTFLPAANPSFLTQSLQVKSAFCHRDNAVSQPSLSLCKCVTIPGPWLPAAAGPGNHYYNTVLRPAIRCTTSPPKHAHFHSPLHSTPLIHRTPPYVPFTLLRVVSYVEKC